MDRLWPDGTRVDENGELWVGGCRTSALVEAYGTPLYVLDDQTFRERARAYRTALGQHYAASGQIAYAAKAYLNLAIAQLACEEGLDLDVVSGGELYAALQAGFPPERIHFHGNNKSAAELSQALDAGIGRIVVDNFHEIELLANLIAARSAPSPVRIWLRLSPGIQAHTHTHIQTGHTDTKFGFTISTGDAERAVVQAMQMHGVELVGLHSHIGSQIYEADALAAAAKRLAEFAAEMRDRHGFTLRELSPGGGWGVPMTEDDPEAPVVPYVAALAEALVAACRAHGLALPHLVLEPGRSLIAPAAVAVYTIGARKDIAGVRTYVSVDGGMADNIRPALYGAKYTALRVPGSQTRKAEVYDPRSEVVTLVGKFCESGDILIRDIELPRLEPGDLLAIPMAGAYTLSMASNYNLAPRPAVVVVRDGQARLMQRREKYADLIARDLPLSAPAPNLPRNVNPIHGRLWKYQALGNDYLVLDPVDWPMPPSSEQIRRICDRHWGVGADGILWGPIPRLPESSRQASVSLRLYNPDGGEFEKSGNGLRIFARYLWDRGYATVPDFTISSPGGTVAAHVLEPTASRIAMDMGTLSFDSRAIPVAGPVRDVVEEEVGGGGYKLHITGATIGNPHCVVFVADPTPDLARTLGPQLEQWPLYPNRTNVQFVRVLDHHALRMEIWERGAGYTLASGTSACAAAGAAIRTGRCESPVTVQMPGGSVLVEIAPDWSTRLTGTVGLVFEGTMSADVLGA